MSQPTIERGGLSGVSGMTWTQNVQTDDEEQRKYAHHLGYAILNCGNLEMLTYSYAAVLVESDIFATGLSGTFSRRRKRIEVLLAEVQLPDELRKRTLELWRQAADVMQWRNLIAHNPITILGVKRTDGSEQGRLTVVDMAKTRSRADVKHLTVGELAKIANRAQDVAHGLDECLREIATAVVQDDK